MLGENNFTMIWQMNGTLRNHFFTSTLAEILNTMLICNQSRRSILRTQFTLVARPVNPYYPLIWYPKLAFICLCHHLYVCKIPVQLRTHILHGVFFFCFFFMCYTFSIFYSTHPTTIVGTSCQSSLNVQVQ